MDVKVYALNDRGVALCSLLIQLITVRTKRFCLHQSVSYPFNLCTSQLRFTWIKWVHVVQGGVMVLPMDQWQI